MKPTQILIASISPLAVVAELAHAAEPPPQVRIYTDDTGKYTYHGCYNETTLIEGSAGTRALSGGDSLVQPNGMTVPICLQFCQGGSNKYRYAGVEWSRECWCSQSLAGIAKRLDDSECSFPCSGNKSQACGGQLKLNVYRTSAAPRGAALSGAAAALALVSVALTML
ncbi:hypothetical protein PWT90_06967 [Aphanocladium album]|nr:hypothetical protein PWT90_06967 [Aphanocladium album]